MKFHSKLKKGSLFLYSIIIIQSWTEKECEFECNATHSIACARCMNWNFFSKEFALFKLNYIFWMHWIFLSYYDLFLSFEWQRGAACIEVENFQFVERSDPAFNGIFRLSLLWFFSLFLMECQCHYWHTIYSQSIQSSRLHSDFQSRFLFSKSLADPNGLGDSINNKFIRSHSFVVQICIYEYLDLLENPCLLWRVSTTTLKNIHIMWN